MDRCWLLTWTTYGTWLPGDARGSVARVRETPHAAVPRVKQNVYETPYVEASPDLVAASAERMQGASVLLDREQATIIARQLEESARFRGWNLLGASVMANHVHVVLGVPDDPSPSKLLQILKSYASRALNRSFPCRVNGRWWTSGGSTRKLPDDVAIAAASRYVREQRFVLAHCVSTKSDGRAGSPRGTSVPRSPKEESAVSIDPHDEFCK